MQMAVSLLFYPSPPGNASISPARWLFLATLLAFLPGALFAGPSAARGGSRSNEITITLPGDVPLVLARIPAGSFVMGSPDDERGRDADEGPLTNVTISRDFYMGKHEVTQAQWLALMGSWPVTAPSPGNGMGPSHPAYFVSWNDTQVFIAALNAHIVATGQGPAAMRLPTEAEWEHAARAGTTTRFSFGDSLSVADGCEDDGIRGLHMWYCGNNAALGQPGYGTKSVGLKLPNAFGLHDMHGNVGEWCQDWSGAYPGGNVTDPVGPSSGTGRVLRGGGWSNDARNCRSASRSNDSPSAQFSSIGFRLASG